MSEEKFNQVKYQNEYNRQNYDRVTVMLPKGMRDRLRVQAKSEGISVNQLIVRAIRGTIARDSDDDSDSN